MIIEEVPSERHEERFIWIFSEYKNLNHKKKICRKEHHLKNNQEKAIRIYNHLKKRKLFKNINWNNYTEKLKEHIIIIKNRIKKRIIC